METYTKKKNKVLDSHNNSQGRFCRLRRANDLQDGSAY